MGTVTITSKVVSNQFDHTDGYFHALEDEVTPVIYNFTNKLASGDTLASPCNVTALDEYGSDKSASIITATAISSPNCSFAVQNTNAGNTYEITIKSSSSSNYTYIGKVICESYGSVTLNANIADPNANSYITLKEANDYIKNVRGNSTIWDKLSIEGKKRLLIEAAREIDKLNFIDNKYYDNQAMQFPRNSHNVLSGDVSTPCTVNSFKNTSFSNSAYGSDRSNSNFWKYGTVHITTGTPLYDIRTVNTSNITTDVITTLTDFSATPANGSDFVAFEPLNQKVKDAQCEQALNIINNANIEKLQSYGVNAKSVSIGDVSVNFKDNSSSSSVVTPKAKSLLAQWVQRHRRVLRA